MIYTIVSINKEVDYSQVLVDSFDTVRKSNDGLLMVLKYESKPEFITETEYDEDEIMVILNSDDNWIYKNPLMENN